MDKILQLLNSHETKLRMRGVNELETFLQVHGVGENFNPVMESLLPCLKDNNFRVCLGAIGCVQALLRELGEQLRPYLDPLIGACIERMGDNKIQVREKASQCFVNMIRTFSFNLVLEKNQLHFRHKNAKVREQLLLSMTNALQQIPESQVSKTNAVRLAIESTECLENSSPDVRDAAIKCLESVYVILGASIWDTLDKKDIRENHLKSLQKRFDKIDESEDLTSSKGNSYADSKQKLRSSKVLLSSSRSAATIPSTKLSSSAAASDVELSLNVKHIEISSQKDLQREMAQIKESLESTKDWNERAQALKRLQSISKSAARFLSFVEDCKQMHELLCAQIGDLRSSIVREACVAVEALAVAMGDAFDPLADRFIGSLLKLTFVKIQVISISGDRCVRSILKCTKNGYNYVVSRLLSEAKSRNQMIRAKCLEYLAFICKSWSRQHIERYADKIVALLPITLSDAQGDVRTASRLCYWAFANRFPTDGSDIIEHLDATTQKHLYADASTALVMESSSSVAFHPASSSKDILRSSDYTPASSHKNNSLSNSDGMMNRKAVRVGIDHSNKFSSSPPMQDEEGPKLKTYHSSNRSTTENQQQYHNRATIPEVSSSETTATPTLFHKKGPQRVLRHQPSNDSVGNDQKVSLGSTASRVVDYAPQNSATRQHPLREISQHSTMDDIRMYFNIELFEKAKSTLWSARTSSFEEFNQLLLQQRGDDGDTDALPLLSEYIRLHCDKITGNLFEPHIVDPHHKVCQAALRCLSTFIAKHACLLWKKMPRLLPKIFQKSTDSKSLTRDVAQGCIETIQTQYGHSELLNTMLTKVSEPNQMKLRLVHYQCLSDLIPQATDFFQCSSTHSRHFIMKACHLYEFNLTTTSSHSSSVVHRHDGDESSSSILMKEIGQEWILRLYQYHEAYFREMLKQLPEAVKEPILHCLRAHVLDFHEHSCDRMCSKEEHDDLPSSSGLDVMTAENIEKQDTPESNDPETEEHPGPPVIPLSLIQKETQTLDTVLEIIRGNNYSKKEKYDALDQLMLIESVELWEQHYGEIIFLLFDLAKEDMTKGLETIKIILASFPQLTREYLKPILMELIDCCELPPSKAVGLFAKKILLNQVLRLYPVEALRIVSTHMIMIIQESKTLENHRKKPNHRALISGLLSSLILILPILMKEDDRSSVSTQLDTVLPSLNVYLSHPETVIRQRSMQVYVALFLQLGATHGGLQTHFDQLEKNKQKLITIYVEKEQDRSRNGDQTMIP